MGTVITAEVVPTGEKRDQRGRKLTPPGRIAELLRAYQASGLTQAAFARREGLKYPTFANWVQQSRRVERAQNAAVRFTEVKVSPQTPPAGSAASRVEARLPDGTAIICASATELAAVLRALR